jgi:hypothetical protein
LLLFVAVFVAVLLVLFFLVATTGAVFVVLEFVFVVAFSLLF